MQNVIEIARPYAKAAFEYADSNKQIPQWRENLQHLAKAVDNSLLKNLLANPQYAPQQRAEVCVGLTKDWDKAGHNFIRLLAENHRLKLLPEIVILFEKFEKEKENILDVKVYSAIALDKSDQEKLTNILQKKLKHKIQLHSKEEPSLIGGLILRINDWVLDGSIKGQFERMKAKILV